MKVYPLDWRYSAAIVGLVQYLTRFKKEYELNEDYLDFKEEDINEHDYLKFAEEHFSDYMYHVGILSLMEDKNEEKKEKNIKGVNELISRNTVLKKVLGKIKYDFENAEEIKKLINENREEIIKGTYINGKRLYSKFCNPGQFFKPKGKCCRLKGYYIDMGKKSKGNSYAFDSKTYVFQDEQIFDFIPFAFSQESDSFFINASLDLKNLYSVNYNHVSEAKKYKEENNGKNLNLLEKYNYIKGKIEYDVEIIVNSIDRDRYETAYLRKDSIRILKSIKDKQRNVLGFSYKIDGELTIGSKFLGTGNMGDVCKFDTNSKSTYLSLDKVVVDSILNLIYLDGVINFLLKLGERNIVIGNLISLNELIYSEYFKELKGDNMRKEMHKMATEDAKAIQNFFLKNGRENKLRVYEQKLVTAMFLGDRDRVKNLLMHLSTYTQKAIRVMPFIFDDFDKNKNLAYTFINSLGVKKEEEENEK